MESRVETGALGVGMGLQGHKVIPGSIRAYFGTGILEQLHFGLFHAVWKLMN